ncbi:MAG: hypothetical protein ABIG11_02045 [bacterium]
MEHKLAHLEAEARRLENEKNSLAIELEKTAGRRNEMRERLQKLASDRDEAISALSAARDELAGLEVRQKQMTEELDSLKSGFDAGNEKISALKSEASELQSRVHDSDMEINAASARMEDTSSRLMEDWNLTPEQAGEKYQAQATDHERVTFLRRRLENMGPVNMTAPEEYEALTARDVFLKTQIEDLNKAKSDLRSAINRINATTRENFRHTFDLVQTHFQRIYGRLFAGGEAALRLTMPDNLLETGIEIMAQPPGKRLQSISQLSGGEKALTALALLFSFFCVNPSPFCIMDEADAPLDDANVERFTTLLKDFVQQTQFIMITHNKRSMEVADILYGVTMEESGVSQVISVSLKKAVETAEAMQVAAVSN